MIQDTRFVNNFQFTQLKARRWFMMMAIISYPALTTLLFLQA